MTASGHDHQADLKPSLKGQSKPGIVPLDRYVHDPPLPTNPDIGAKAQIPTRTGCITVKTQTGKTLLDSLLDRHASQVAEQRVVTGHSSCRISELPRFTIASEETVNTTSGREEGSFMNPNAYGLFRLPSQQMGQRIILPKVTPIPMSRNSTSPARPEASSSFNTPRSYGSLVNDNAIRRNRYRPASSAQDTRETESEPTWTPPRSHLPGDKWEARDIINAPILFFTNYPELTPAMEKLRKIKEEIDGGLTRLETLAAVALRNSAGHEHEPDATPLRVKQYQSVVDIYQHARYQAELGRHNSVEKAAAIAWPPCRPCRNRASGLDLLTEVAMRYSNPSSSEASPATSRHWNDQYQTQTPGSIARHPNPIVANYLACVEPGSRSISMILTPNSSVAGRSKENSPSKNDPDATDEDLYLTDPEKESVQGDNIADELDKAVEDEPLIPPLPSPPLPPPPPLLDTPMPKSKGKSKSGVEKRTRFSNEIEEKDEHGAKRRKTFP